MIAQKYQKTLDKVKPYLFCNAKNCSYFNLSPMGIDLGPPLLFDCTKTNSEEFFSLLTKMDELSFADQAMGMDRWVFYDCSAMPGAIFGFAILAHNLDMNTRKLMQISDEYQGYVPLSMYIAIPTVEPGHWFGHNLSSLNKFLDGQFSGLGLLTKAYALLVMKIHKQYGATQWNSPALNIHTQLSPLKLITSYTPNHTHKNSLTYLAEYSEDKILDVLREQRNDAFQTSFVIEGDDVEGLMTLQRKIENGEEFYLIGRAQTQDEKIFYSIYQSKGQ